MPTLTIAVDRGEQGISFVSGRSLRHILDATDYRVRSGCRETGACGLCRVRVLTGDAGEPSANERLILGDLLLAEGVRLACQILPERDLGIAILSPAPKSAWRPLDREEPGRSRRLFAGPLPDLPGDVKSPYGVAVDLGTSHVTLSLFDLAGARLLAGCHGPNPQANFGADVMTRLVAAAESPEQSQQLRLQALKAIGSALTEIALREGINLLQVVRLTLVGNTAMLALLSGRNSSLLLQPGQWMNGIDCLPLDSKEWTSQWGIHPLANITVLPPLAGFVGSDLLAGVVTVSLMEQEAGSLLIDFGTNSEIALWDGATLWVTSVAGGPAFEGSGLRHGLPGEPGAIYRVRMGDGVADCEVIGGGEPLGICGTGLVDLVAGLISSGELTAKGRFASTVPAAGFLLARGKADIVLCKGDVDLFQRAKAAVAVAIQVLLQRAGMAYGDLRRICVSGAFGAALDVVNAQRIGLLPVAAPDRVELCGNTALAGCELALLSPAVVERLAYLGTQARIVNLAHCPEFSTLFLEHLYLRPCEEFAP